MSQPCGHWTPGQKQACGAEAEWFGTYLLGAWIAHVFLCEKHVRIFHMMVMTMLKVNEQLNGPVPMQLNVGIIEEIYSTERPAELYQPGADAPAKVWTCSECDSKIVRSLQTGKWISVEVRETQLVNAALRPHEHTPG